MNQNVLVLNTNGEELGQNRKSAGGGRDAGDRNVRRLNRMSQRSTSIGVDLWDELKPSKGCLEKTRGGGLKHKPKAEGILDETLEAGGGF